MLVYLDDIRLNAVCDGPASAPPVVFIHGLGADLTLWSGVVARMPRFRTLRFDLRGHGLSDAPPPPYAMGALIRDCERLIGHFGMRDAVVVGHGAGGLVAQGLAVKRLDQVRALVLANTALRMAVPDIWARRIAVVREGGVAAIADTSLQQCFGHRWRVAAQMQVARAMLEKTSPDGWIGVASAVAGSDFYQTTATLRLSTLVIAGSDDATTPPDMQRDLADLVTGAEFHLLRDAGHLTPLDQPDAFAARLAQFLGRIGHA